MENIWQMNFPKRTKLTSYEQFVELSNDFDQRVGTKTVWSKLTMFDIFEKILGEDSWWDIDYQIQKWVDNAFSIKTEFTQDDQDIPQSPLGKMNSVYLTLNDIKNGKNFYSPITLSLFKNGKIPIHPGSTRLILADVYNKPIDLCITDYNNNFRKRFPDVEFLEVEDYYFDFSDEMHELHEDWTWTGHCPTYANMTDDDVQIKQISTYMIPTTDDFSFHHPRDVTITRWFRLNNDCITVNDMPIAKKIDNVWKIVLE